MSYIFDHFYFYFKKFLFYAIQMVNTSNVLCGSQKQKQSLETATAKINIKL